jgi:hypothetical protein
MGARSTKQTQSKNFRTAIWEKTLRTFIHLIGGRTDSRVTCPAPSQEHWHIWHQTSGAKMAQPYFELDDQQWLPCSQKSKDDFQEDQGPRDLIISLMAYL